MAVNVTGKEMGTNYSVMEEAALWIISQWTNIMHIQEKRNSLTLFLLCTNFLKQVNTIFGRSLENFK